MFNMSFFVLDSSFKTLSPFIDALVNDLVNKDVYNKCMRQCVPLSLGSKFQLVNILELALQVNFVYQLSHHVSS